MSHLENFDIADLNGSGKYQIPEIEPVTEFTAERFGRLIYWNTEKEPEITCLHTFSYDYQFNSVWTKPDAWLNRLKKFDSVLAPDFSLYRDMPRALQIYNHYRKHWIARYWYENGIKVIPNVCWSTPDNYDWCFEGEPTHSIVALASTGALRDKEARKLFLMGYEEMKKRLEPIKIIFYGSIPKELANEDLICIEHHYDQMRTDTKFKLQRCIDDLELTKIGE